MIRNSVIVTVTTHNDVCNSEVINITKKNSYSQENLKIFNSAKKTIFKSIACDRMTDAFTDRNIYESKKKSQNLR